MIRRRPKIETIWASAFRAAGGVARKATSSEQDVIRAVSEELQRARLRGSVALLTNDGLLQMQSPSLSKSVFRTLERLSGQKIRGYTFDPKKVEAYHRALTSSEAVFTNDRSQVVGQMMPETLKPLLPRIMHIIGSSPTIIAPLVLADQPIGTLSISAPWLEPADKAMVAALADHISISLDHVRARERIQTTLNREKLRNQVASTISSALDLRVVLESVIQIAAEVTGADAGAIGLIETDGETIAFPYLYELPDNLHASFTHRDQGLTWQVVKTRSPILLENYPSHPNADPLWVQAGLQALVGVPLLAGDRAIGGMGLFIKSRDRVFTSEQVELAQAIASMAAIAIENARLYTDAKRRAEESQALIHTARSISASLDQATVLQLIAEQAKNLLQSDASRIHLLEPDSGLLRCVVAIGPHSDAAMAMKIQSGQGLAGYVIDHGQPIIANNAASDPRGVTIPGTPENETECLALSPLNVRQRTLGVMTVQRTGLERPFFSSDLELLAAFAAQAAVTIENAHLFSQIAGQAQRLEIEVAERTRDLSLSEARYRALVETALAGIFQIDRNGKIQYVNQAMAELLEYQPEVLIGNPLSEFLPKDLSWLIDSFYARMRGDGPTHEVHEIELRAKSNRRTQALLATSLISDEEGHPQGLSGLVSDISKLKELESELQTERDRLDALLTNIGDAVMVTDPEGVIEYVNPGWERLTGYTADEALGKTSNILQSGEHSEALYSEMWTAIKEGQPWRGEVVNLRKDGTLYDAALTIAPVVDDIGKVIVFVGVLHDISALKALDRLKSQFVSDVSHELRTPLTNIRLYLDLLARTTGDQGKSLRYLRTLSRESDRLANLIDDLLSLSRLDAKAVPFVPSQININDLLGALAEDRSTLAAERGLRIVTKPQTDLPDIYGDERLLTQVFTNLLTNAMNYTPTGGEITLCTHEDSNEDERWIIVEVVDTGLGIPRDEINMLFHRFFRGSASQSTGAAGTGLGLAICKEIIERHHGKISVESDGVPGHGTRFSVWLPVSRIENNSP
jgi:PAS domain S-box-containing protein